MDDYNWESKQVGVMYAGKVMGKDDIVYACFNSYWEEIEITLPDIPGRDHWLCVLDTYADPVIKRRKVDGLKYKMGPRSAIVLEFR
jgi:glycogen operon protein